MMRTEKRLDPYAWELATIWRSGWSLRYHRTPIGTFVRLEKGILYRGAPRTGWWWRPTLKQAITLAAAEALANPNRPTNSHPLYDDAEWEVGN